MTRQIDEIIGAITEQEVIDLIALNSRKRKLPNFIVKLLDAWEECGTDIKVGECLLKKQILPPSVLNSIAVHVQELHFGQTSELWEIFSKKYSVFGNTNEEFEVKKVVAGSQDAVHGSTKDIQDGVLLCSQNMARLLTMITKYKTQFAKLVPFLIGDYADSVQYNTLETNIKGNLSAGLNRLLSLCSENSLKVVALSINHSCREIFYKIVKDYNQSRYRGYV